MNAHRIEAVLAEDKKLILEDLPFRAGDAVEVILLERSDTSNGEPAFPLRGKPLRYDDPFEPATSGEDWDALR